MEWVTFGVVFAVITVGVAYLMHKTLQPPPPSRREGLIGPATMNRAELEDAPAAAKATPLPGIVQEPEGKIMGVDHGPWPMRPRPGDSYYEEWKASGLGWPDDMVPPA